MNRNLLILLASLLTVGCQSARVEPTTMSVATPAAAASKTAYKAGPSPTEAELREAIKRNYDDAVMIDNRGLQHFLIGDFNGDKSEDVAVIVKPGKGKLSELNSEYANWILEDPHQIHAQKIRVNARDHLLAVIHGVKREGWRNSMAKQTYLLKNIGNESFETQSQRRGDVMRGTTGIILWTGAKYVWHPITIDEDGS